MVFLDVPKSNKPEGDYTPEERAKLKQEVIDLFRSHNQLSEVFLLPFGVILETGNHIADCPNGRRHVLIQDFVAEVRSSLHNERPYQIVGIPASNQDIEMWLQSYTDNAPGGAGMVDSISIFYYNDFVAAYPGHNVRIWSFDNKHLTGYDTNPTPSKRK